MTGRELLLVGSIPLDTPQEVFQTFGAPLGKYLFAMPDGEVGPRRHCVAFSRPCDPSQPMIGLEPVCSAAFAVGEPNRR